MGKWNKAPPQVSEQFLQNEERRKQMIIQAGKRRKQKQKKLQQQAQISKKNQEQALLKHKQQKKDAYVKYLRNNMHDKYEEMKRNQKLSQPEVRTKSKWKKDTLDSNSQIKGENNLEGLDLQVHIPNTRTKVVNNNKIINKVGGQVVRNIPPENPTNNRNPFARQQQPSNNWSNPNNQYNLPNEKYDYRQNQQQQRGPIPVNKESQKRRLLQDEFENMWKQEHEQEQEEKQIDYDLSMEETIFDDMLASKLLDSLDLDLDTVSRGKKLDKRIKDEKKQKEGQKPQNKEIDEIKNMIGYESVLMSIDERSQMVKKYSQFMTNEVQQQAKAFNTKKEDQIGKAFSKNKDKINPAKNQKTSKSSIQVNQQKSVKNMNNEGEVFNELKNKKQGKILNWAQGEAQQADDLFSNCSTNKKSKTRGFQLLKEINKEIQEKGKKSTTSKTSPINQPQMNMKKKEKPLQIIPEKKINSSLQKLRQRSFDKKAPTNSANNLQYPSNHHQNNRSQQIRRSQSKQKIVQVSKPRPNRLNSAQINRSNQPPQPQPPRNVSRERVNKTATNSFKQSSDVSYGYGNATQQQSRTRTDSRRSLSKEKDVVNGSAKDLASYNQGNSRNPPLRIQQTTSSARQTPVPPTNSKKLPHLPPTSYQRPSYNGDQITIATQDQVFQVESFIKNELLSLNQQQRQIQQQLKNIHVQNKEKIKEVEKKYEIKTDYRYSHQLKQKEEGIEEEIEDEDNKTNNSYQKAHKKQTEDELQESIQRLDDMLLRRQIVNKQKGSRITQQDNESQSTHRSIINPMSDPIALHKQVLQLAQNLSRFQGEPEDPSAGYGAKLRMMKKKSVQKQNSKTQQKSQPSQNTSYQKRQKKQTEIQLSQSQDVNYSQLNSVQAKSKVSKVSSKASKPPQLQYSQHQHGYCGIPSGYNESGLLNDDQDVLEDSIEKGKIEVNQRLRRMLLD